MQLSMAVCCVDWKLKLIRGSFAERKNAVKCSINTFGHVCMLLILLSNALVLLSCSSKGNSTQISEDLADRLTDSLDFEGGTLEEGDPPKGDSNPLAPQITSIRGPEEFQLGASFSTTISSDYNINFANFKSLKDGLNDPVAKVIIRVLGAQLGYFIVPVELVNQSVELAGILEGDPVLRNIKFRLEFALQTESGLTGAYKPLNFNVKDTPPQENISPMNSLNLGDAGGEFKDSGRPDGSSNMLSPQIIEVVGPEKLDIGEDFKVDLLTSFEPAENIVAAIMTFPLSDGFFEIDGKMVETLEGAAFRINGTMSSPDIQVGDFFTFLFALKAGEEQVGEYRSWSVLIVDSSTGGDSDVLQSINPNLPDGMYAQPMSLDSASFGNDNFSMTAKQSLGPFKRKMFAGE